MNFSANTVTLMWVFLKGFIPLDQFIFANRSEMSKNVNAAIA